MITAAFTEKSLNVLNLNGLKPRPYVAWRPSVILETPRPGNEASIY